MLSFVRASVLLVTPLLSAAVYVFPDNGARAKIPSQAANEECNTYYLSDTYMGAGFFTSWEFETYSDGDPTHGRVNYVNQSYAMQQGLAEVEGSTFIMRVDSTTVLNPNGTGRDSVRIKSKKQYTEHLVVFDIAHIPQGCATWPAVWESNDEPDVWPDAGEVDIIEGANDNGTNLVSLHTTANCTMPENRTQTGTTVTTDCWNATDSNAGCGVQSTEADSYGPAFNAAGGGWYAFERSQTGISVWHWGREDKAVPMVVQNGGLAISSATFGTPTAYFPSTTNCSIPSHFGPNNIIFDLTLCGDWAGNTYATSGCPGTCVDYVNNEPEAFVNAYWSVNAVRVYE